MKSLFRFGAYWFISLILAVTARAAASDVLRTELLLATDWRFHRGVAKGAEAISFDDAAWATVALPHTWNAQDGQDGGGYYRGDGWYRRHFQISAGWAGKQVYLQFDGANRSTEAFLNGHRLGLHRGGFACFRFDATQALDFAGDNVVAMRVNNGEHNNIAPSLADSIVG